MFHCIWSSFEAFSHSATKTRLFTTWWMATVPEILTLVWCNGLVTVCRWMLASLSRHVCLQWRARTLSLSRSRCFFPKFLGWKCSQTKHIETWYKRNKTTTVTSLSHYELVAGSFETIKGIIKSQWPSIGRHSHQPVEGFCCVVFWPTKMTLSINKLYSVVASVSSCTVNSLVMQCSSLIFWNMQLEATWFPRFYDPTISNSL